MQPSNTNLGIKAITYRAASMLITFFVTYIFTRSLPLTTTATVTIEILKTLWYYSFDSIWEFRIRDFISSTIEKVGGIKENYPLIPLSEKIKGFIALTRPLTMCGALIAGFFLVSLASYYYGTPFSFTLALATGICLGILHGASQALNQAITEEIAIDIINKPYRPVVRGLITQREAIAFAITLYAFSAAFAFMIKPIFVIGIAVIALFSVFYTIPPVRIKRIFVLNNVWQGIARGMLPVLAVFGIFNDFHFDPFPLALATVICLWITGAQSSKDIDDIEGDTKFGIRNFFTVLGKPKALAVMAILMGSSFVALNLFIWYFHYLPATMLPLNLLVFPSFGIVRSLNRKATLAENNYGWVMFYGTMSLWFVLPAILSLITEIIT